MGYRWYTEFHARSAAVKLFPRPLLQRTVFQRPTGIGGEPAVPLTQVRFTEGLAEVFFLPSSVGVKCLAILQPCLRKYRHIQGADELGTDLRQAECRTEVRYPDVVLVYPFEGTAFQVHVGRTGKKATGLITDTLHAV